MRSLDLLFGYLFNLFFIHLKLFISLSYVFEVEWPCKITLRCCFERPYLYTEHKFSMLLSLRYKHLNICGDLHITIQTCFYIMDVWMYICIWFFFMICKVSPNQTGCLPFQIVHLLACLYKWYRLEVFIFWYPYCLIKIQIF